MDSNTPPAQPLQAAPPAEHDRTLRNVFVSYASQDRKFALRLARDLRKEGVNVWIDASGIDPGEVWSKKLEEALRASATVVLVVSPHSRASDYVDKELHLASEFHAGIIPVLRRKCEPWLLISNLQHIDFTEVYAEGFAKLMRVTPPRRTLLRQMLVFVKRNRIHFYIMAAVIAVLFAVYSLTPSDTSFAVLGGDGSGMVVNVHNRGGQPSMLAGDSFALDFGALPIEPQKLVLQDPHRNSRIPGHSDVQIRLTSPSMLTPRAHPGLPYFFYNEQELRPLLAQAKVTLRGEIRESNDRRQRHSAAIQAKNIETFIYEVFPDVVSRVDIVP